MEYKDFCEKYDTKDFEKLAREYTKMYGTGVNVLSNSENKTKNFLQAYENLLDILFELCKNIDKNFEKLKEKNSVKNIKNCVKNLCKIYQKIDGNFYFSTSKCRVNFDVKKCQKNGKIFDEILDKIKGVFLTNFDLLNCDEKGVFFDNIFDLIKYIFLIDF